MLALALYMSIMLVSAVRFTTERTVIPAASRHNCISGIIHEGKPASFDVSERCIACKGMKVKQKFPLLKN